MLAYQDSIVAQATAIGSGGVGIVRISGPATEAVAMAILGKLPRPRYADYLPFYADDGSQIDQGIALFFKGPNSFTGEDVLELQGHGGQVILDMLIRSCLKVKDVRPAKPGEFSERAFLNDKLDLAQAEAIADLIEASSEQAARSALRSLQGAFSTEVHALVERAIGLRMYVEAAIDFPEEEIDFLSDGKIQADLSLLKTQLQDVLKRAQQGAILRDGMRVVIAGKPNAGKSSLLNALAGRDSAIVTNIAGTTRDVLKEHIDIDGMPLHIIDTAGLRDNPDEVERIGIQRAWQEIQQADGLLLMLDDNESDDEIDAQITTLTARLPDSLPVTLVRNKIDVSGHAPGMEDYLGYKQIRLSAKQGDGLGLLTSHLKHSMGYTANNEGQFSARRRHIDALEQALEHVSNGQSQLEQHWAGELLAEELRLAQQQLNEITGEFSSDDLLGRIFSSFCIGK